MMYSLRAVRFGRFQSEPELDRWTSRWASNDAILLPRVAARLATTFRRLDVRGNR